MSRLTVGFLVLMFVAACGGAGSTTAPTGTAGQATATAGQATATAGQATATAGQATATAGQATATAGQATATAGQATVAVAETTLGKVLVGPNAKTLYGFTPDQTAGMPTCYDACATTWPALTVTGDFSVGAGLDKSKFKTVTRTDGTTQLQIGDYPLYYYAPDVNPGDVTGQGVGGKWFVVGADGQLIGAPA